MTEWEVAITDSYGQLLASFLIGYGMALLITAFKKFIEMV